MRVPLRLLALAPLLAFATATRADISLPKIFGDRMVLQRDAAVPVWGQAAPGEPVTVHFAGQEKSATADAAGKWKTALDPLGASFEPRDFSVSGSSTVTLHGVLVGEVWLCGGQSNMEMAVGLTTAGAKPESDTDAGLAEAIKIGAWPGLRLFRVEKRLQPPEVVSNGWTECSGEALAKFSAAAFFFGRELHADLGVPIALIESCWGGSRIEEWISDADYAPLEKILGADAERCFERNATLISRDYDAMIQPLAPFALRGVLWYQGESQIIAYNDGAHYAEKFKVLVDSWRRVWGQPELPFYSVQLAPFLYSTRKDKIPHDDAELPKFWQSQLATAALPHCGLVPIADTVTDVKNIHPAKKSIVGHRLAALALSETYGRKGVVHSGPVFAECQLEGDHATIHFATPSPLAARDGQPLTDFEIAGTDGKFVPATAVIRGKARVEVSSPEVPKPAAVRFAWHEIAQPNLMNTAGWPAYAFNTSTP